MRETFFNRILAHHTHARTQYIQSDSYKVIDLIISEI